MTPKVVRAYTEFTKMLLEQASVDVENWVIRKLAIALQLKIDKAGLYGLGTTYEPQGIKNVTGINTEDFGAAAPSYAELVSMESKINADNADLGAFTYITNSTIYGGFKTTEKFTTTGQTILEPGGTVNNHRVIVSNQVESGDVFLGVWSQAYLALWGAVDLQVNPYSLDTTGQLRVTAGQMVDYAVAHPESFCRGNNNL
jgi:HK97 family phage major capsid protein